MKNLFLFIGFSMISQIIKAQLPDYYVYLTYGDIWIQQQGINSVKIKPRQLINASDIIELKDNNSEIELVDKDDDFIVLNTKGFYKASNLKEKVAQKTEGLTKRYLEMVWQALFHSSSDFEAYKDESVAASYGGGARGKDCGIGKYPPNHSFFSKDSLIFKWENKDIQKNYRFNLYDSSRNVLIELLVRDTQLVLLTRSQPLGEYYWSVDQATHPCHDIPKNKIILISKEEEDSLTKLFIKKIPPNKDNILYNLQISELLGTRGFVDKALLYFNKSWELFMKNK